MGHLQEVMGFDDNNYVTEPVLAVQPEGASAAETTLSDNSGEVGGSGASILSSCKHQEQVWNLKDKCGVMDVLMGPDNFIDKTKAPLKEPEITSVALVRSDLADPTPSNSNGGGNGSGASCPWSLSHGKHVLNLKNSFKRAFHLSSVHREKWAAITDHQWLADVVVKLKDVVVKLRDDRRLGNSNFEIKRAPIHLKDIKPLHLAVLMGDLEMVQEILKTYSKVSFEILVLGFGELQLTYSVLDLAIVCGESKIVHALLQKDAKANTHGCAGSLQLAVLSARVGQMIKTSEIIQSLVNKGIDINALDGLGYTAFYIAVVTKNTDIVKILLKWQDKIQLNDPCQRGRPPIQIANEEGFKDIESALMQCEDVRRFIDEAFRDRQAYVDAANAILVGAALIASVTFASWLQPPLSYTTSYYGSSVEYVDVEHNFALGCFWVFNTLSFYFAMGTVVVGAHSVLPRRQLFIKENVKKLSQNLVLTSILLAFSVFFVIVAFGIAGFIVLIPILRYRWYMIAPTILGGIVCVGSIGYLFKSLWENRPWIAKNRQENRIENKSEENQIKSFYNKVA